MRCVALVFVMAVVMTAGTYAGSSLLQDIVISYANDGPHSSPQKFIIPSGVKVISGEAKVQAYVGGEAPYSLTAVTFVIDGHSTTPNTYRVAKDQVRGEGTLWVWGEGEKKSFTLDLSAITTPVIEPNGKGSFEFNYLPFLTPGVHTLDCYMSVGSKSWTAVKLTVLVKIVE